MKLSVIIPVYKVENTLDRCVGSVLGQGIADMEVILVNDGSPDKCPQMCDEWAANDSRVRVIHKVNGGLSDARNAAIDVAVGDYLTFVDSDDFLMDGSLKLAMQWLEEHGEVDILETSMEIQDASRMECLLDDCTYPTVMDYCLTTKAWSHSYACNKIYRRGLFDGLRFAVGRYFEDLLLLPLLLRKKPVVATSALITYCYTWTSNSISSSVSRKKTWELLRAELLFLIRLRLTPFHRNVSHLYYLTMCRVYDLLTMGIRK